MVRTFFFLLSFLTDYETVTLIPHLAFTAGLVSASILGCVGVGLAVGKKTGKQRWRQRRAESEDLA